MLIYINCFYKIYWFKNWLKIRYLIRTLFQPLNYLLAFMFQYILVCLKSIYHWFVYNLVNLVNFVASFLVVIIHKTTIYLFITGMQWIKHRNCAKYFVLFFTKISWEISQFREMFCVNDSSEPISWKIASKMCLKFNVQRASKISHFA